MQKKQPLTVAEYFTEQVNLCGKTQVQIAEEMGFDIPNVISNIKKGKTKLPLTRVGLAAKSLGIDAIFLLKMVLVEYFPPEPKKPDLPTVWDVFEKATGRLVTQNEFDIIEQIRVHTNNQNPAMRSDEAAEKLSDFANLLTYSATSVTQQPH